MTSQTIVPLVGSYFRPPAQALLSIAPTGSALRLEAEPQNLYDPNAIAVFGAFSAIDHELLRSIADRLYGCGDFPDFDSPRQYHRMAPD